MTIASAYRSQRRRDGLTMSRFQNRRAASRPRPRTASPSATNPLRRVRVVGEMVLDAVARRTARLVLLIDIIIGLSWLLGDPNRSRTPVYVPARSLTSWLPGDAARWWGAILLILAAAAWLATRYLKDLAARHTFAGLTGYWACWLVAYAWGAATEPHAGLVPIGFAAMCVVGNRRPAIAPQRVSSKAD